MSERQEPELVFWGEPEHTSASFDFRSDVLTTPSRGMLAAIVHTTLNDDVYHEDKTTTSFELEMATICGHEAAAFVITGTMANQLAVRTLLFQPPYAILTDAHSHIIHWEARGTALVSGSVVQAIRPANQRYLTLNDIKKHAGLTDDVHKCPTRDWATDHDIAIYMDGARLWEAQKSSSTNGSDGCWFQKGYSDLETDPEGFGGGMRQAGVLAATARQAVLENFGLKETCTRPTLKKSHEMASFIAQLWTSKGGLLLREVETNIVWVNLAAAGIGIQEWNLTGKKHGIRLNGKRIVVHHRICNSALARLSQVMEEVLGGH
uniref:Aromatic amino acid beta-eliminating lyase/threonine aldolase domain-containing protein n=1 Tax=Bionectria ochroleuca TaxID=29856 RepID=A0A8H7K587_BIOOC